MSSSTRQADTKVVRIVVLAALVVGAFLGAYQFAQARNGGQNDAFATNVAGAPVPGVTQASGGTGDPAAGGCACCGSTAPTENGITGEPVEGVAAAQGDVQTISVDLSQGYYQPNVIKLAAGVPAQITFGQSSGCTAQVLSRDIGFFEDLSYGPATVDVPALEAGEYSFSCGMEMVFGKIIVE